MNPPRDPKRRWLLLAVAVVLLGVTAAWLLSRPGTPPIMTAADVAAIKAVVRERTGAPVGHVRPDRDGTVLVWTGEHPGGRQFRVRKVSGAWTIVGETVFYALQASPAGERR